LKNTPNQDKTKQALTVMKGMEGDIFRPFHPFLIISPYVDLNITGQYDKA